MATSIYAFAVHRLATEMSLLHIRKLAADEMLDTAGYDGATALCGSEVHRDVSEVSARIINWSRRMRETGRSAPGRVCVGCSDLYDERNA